MPQFYTKENTEFLILSYRCNYCTQERTGDITVGDYWGIEREHSKFYSTKGVSVMLLNTDKALKWFGQVEDMFYTQESTFEQPPERTITCCRRHYVHR